MSECLECNDKTEVNGKPCQSCCEHEFSIDEGYTCTHCSFQGDLGGLIDWTEIQFGDR